MATSRLNGKSGENSPHLLGNIEEGNGKKTNAEIPPSPYKEDEKRKNLEEKKIKVLSTRWPRCQGPAVFSFIGVERRPLSRRSGRLGAGHQQEGQIAVKAYETENLKGWKMRKGICPFSLRAQSQHRVYARGLSRW